jgi:DNA-binding transcriptional ArsR family regulator
MTEPTEGSRRPRRPATEDEARAMASSTRLRILRLCLDGALTNKEIAARLGKDPASVLYHVRRLVDTGFLVAEEVRRGTRGARERPYRATGKSWVLDVVEPRDRRAGGQAMFDAFVEEARAADIEQLAMIRLGVRLTAEQRTELYSRLHELFDGYIQADPAPDADPWSLFFAAHPDPRPVGRSVGTPVAALAVGAGAGQAGGAGSGAAGSGGTGCAIERESAMPTAGARDTIEGDD